MQLCKIAFSKIKFQQFSNDLEVIFMLLKKNLIKLAIGGE